MELAPRSSGGRLAAALVFPALVLLISILAIAPLSYPGSFQTQNGLNAVYNLMDLDAHLGSAGWAPVYGRGYDLLRMDGPLPYTLAESLHLSGAGFLPAIQAVYALGLLLSGLGMFALGRKVFHSEGAGLIAAALYVYFPYHLAVVYVRGAFGEALAFALFPWALRALVPIRRRSRADPARSIACGLTFALVILSLPGLGLVFAVAAAGAAIVLSAHAVDGEERESPGRESKGFSGPPRMTSDWRAPIAVIAAGAAAGLVLLLPSFFRYRGTLDSYAFRPAFVYPFQLLTASWGTAFPKGNYLEQFPFQIGIGALGLTVLAVALSMRGANGQADTAAPRILPVAVGGALVAALAMLPLAAILWEGTGSTLLLEFPFQLLAIIGVALALAGGSIALADRRMAETPMLATLAIIPILAVYAYLAPDYHDFTPVRPPLAVFNQNELALLDYSILRPPSTFRHGATVQVQLEWQALRQVDHDYTVFVHVVDENGKMWGGEDVKPKQGTLPTTQWAVGRVIDDPHSVQIDLNGPPQGYHLEVGLYTAVTGERAATESGATEVRIDENRE